MRVALAAAAEQTDRVVLDAAAPTSFVMRRPAIWACAQGQTWTEPWASQELQAAFDASTATELAVLSARPQAADPQATGIGPEVRVIVELVAGLRGPELDVILRRLAARWAADERIAFGVDSIAVELRGVSG